MDRYNISTPLCSGANIFLYEVLVRSYSINILLTLSFVAVVQSIKHWKSCSKGCDKVIYLTPVLHLYNIHGYFFWQTDGQTNGWTENRQTEGRTDGPTDRWTNRGMDRQTDRQMKTHSERCGLAKLYILTSMLLRWFDFMMICLVLSDLFGYRMHVAPKWDGDCLYSDFDLFCDFMTLTFDLENQ